MQVHGREVGFRFTVGASAKISDLCPDGDISRLGEVLEGQYGEVPGYKPRPLTADEVMTLRMDEFAKLQQAALAVWTEDSRPTVEVEPEKKEGGEDQASS